MSSRPSVTLTPRQRRDCEAWSADELRRRQAQRLRNLVREILPTNAFYQRKLGDLPPPQSLEELAQWPLTSKQELLSEDGLFAANLTYPVERYTRFHRTSGTKGQPLVVLDTEEDWAWWIEAWQFVLDVAEATPRDRAVMAFSYGPFIGFWSAHDAAAARGVLVIPGGGMSSLARLDLIRSARATLVFCTPSYALHLADIARQQGVSLRDTAVRRIIVAGEPGGSLPAVRRQIEEAWDAGVVDHSGASEVGPWGYADAEGRGLYVNEWDFYPEFLDWKTGQPAPPGELSELVLTTLGRAGCPVIRYRTGDLVRGSRRADGVNHFAFLDGGVLGRVDDMLIIRGVNIFPSSIEQILREFPEIAEFRLTAFKEGSMDALRIEIEDARQDPRRVADALQLRLGLKVQVDLAPPGALPRFEAKGQRFLDQRHA